MVDVVGTTVLEEESGHVDPEESQGTGGPRHSRRRQQLDSDEGAARLTRVIAAACSVVLLGALVIAVIVGFHPLATTCVMLFGILGIGSAPLQLSKRISGARFVTLASGIGISVVLLTGSLLIELHWWAAGQTVFWVAAGVALLLHGNTLVTERPWLLQGDTGRMRQTLVGDGRSKSVTALTTIGLVLCIAGAVPHLHAIPGPGGLLTTIGPIWFVGLAMVLVAVGLAWTAQGAVIGLPVLAVAAVVTGTPVVIYDLARYDWTQKHIGVTLYFLQHGTANPRIDIYQSWPGLFAGIAWLNHAGFVHNIEAIARVWPLGATLLGLIAVRTIGRAVGLEDRSAWMAGLLFVIGDTVSQSYFSPQSVAFVASLVLVAVAWQRRDESHRMMVYEWLLILMLGTAIAVTHQLTPFVISGVLLILAIFGLVKSRAIPFVVFAPAVLWATIHTSQVKRYFDFGALGKVTSNVNSPNAALGYHYTTYVHLSVLGQVLAPALLVVLAGIAFLTRRDRVAWAMACCIGSMVGLLFVHYGNEDVLRATLFATPWLALLTVYGDWRRTVIRRATLLLAIPVITVGYLLADVGIDNVYVVRPTDLAAVQYFESTARPNSILVSVGNKSYVAVKSSPNYPNLNYGAYNITKRFGTTTPDMSKAAVYFSQYVTDNWLAEPKYLRVNSDVYVLLTGQAAAQWSADGALSSKDYSAFTVELSRLPAWKVVKQTSTATLLKFIPPETTHSSSASAGGQGT